MSPLHSVLVLPKCDACAEVFIKISAIVDWLLSTQLCQVNMSWLQDVARQSNLSLFRVYRENDDNMKVEGSKN